MTNVEQGRYFAAPLFYSRAVATNQSNQNVKRIQASKVGGKMRRQRSESSSFTPGVYAIVDSMGSLKLTSVFQAPRKCRELLFFSRVDRRFATAGARFSKPCVTPSAIARILRAPVSILRKGEIKLKKKYSAEIVMTANTVSGLSLQYIVPLFIIYQIGIILFRGKDNSTNHL